MALKEGYVDESIKEVEELEALIASTEADLERIESQLPEGIEAAIEESSPELDALAEHAKRDAVAEGQRLVDEYKRKHGIVDPAPRASSSRARRGRLMI
ncbi:MAG: hypothetical protein K6A65_04690 [Succinivibrionaceae bacterium]|nr:hypothetical protein [Succinivibrionaceae bacterium]